MLASLRSLWSRTSYQQLLAAEQKVLNLAGSCDDALC
jgi:hypothetical protein